MFAVPIGEELVPYLQEIAADLSLPILRLIGIPIFRDGLYNRNSQRYVRCRRGLFWCQLSYCVRRIWVDICLRQLY